MKNILCTFAIIVSLQPVSNLSAQELSKKEKKLVGTWVFEFAKMDMEPEDWIVPRTENRFYHDSIIFRDNRCFLIDTKMNQYRKGDWKISADSICFSNIEVTPKTEVGGADYCIELKKLTKRQLILLFPILVVDHIEKREDEKSVEIHFKRIE